MTTIKEQAQAYEPQQTKNITELAEVNVNNEVVVVKYKEGTPDEFTTNEMTVGDDKYRVPTSVLSQLKEQVNNNPDLQRFRVTKTGTGMTTQYTVIPLR